MNNFLPAKKPAPSFLANSPRKNKDARPDKRPAQGASRTPPTTVGARHTLRDVRQQMWLPTPTNGARAVPAGLNALGGGCEAGAPWETWVQLVTPDGCV